MRAQTTPFFTGGPTTTNPLFTYDAVDRLTQFSRASERRRICSGLTVWMGMANRLLGISNGVAAPYVMDNTFPNPADFQMNQYTLTPFVLALNNDANGNLVSPHHHDRPVGLPIRLRRPALFRHGFEQWHADASGELQLQCPGQRNAGAIPGGPARSPRNLSTITRTTIAMATSLRNTEGGVLAVSSVSSLAGGRQRCCCRPYAATGRAAPPFVRFNPAGEAIYLHTDDLGTSSPSPMRAAM